jgi:hypothetical protein
MPKLGETGSEGAGDVSGYLEGYNTRGLCFLFGVGRIEGDGVVRL